jgi:DNA-binding protein HU-beta
VAVAAITKADLLDRVAGNSGVTKADAERVLDSFFDAVVSAAKSGDEVAWPGFGKFGASHRAARTGRNPQTGEAIKIAASNGMRFSPSSTLKTALNTKGKKKKK